MEQQVKPDMNSELSKKTQVENMFDSIAKRYDFLNHFLSLGIDKRWRNQAINKIAEINPEKVLDVATGTGDLAIAAYKKLPVKEVVGVDISEGMLTVGRKKIQDKNAGSVIRLMKADSEDLPFEDNFFDAATVGFGVRNFEHLKKGLSEINRVIKPGGMIAVLEFSKPVVFPVKQLYNFYFKAILPTWGRFISGDSKAYTYLPESVKAFPDGEKFLEILESCGFKNCEQKKLSLGICSLYTGIKL